MLPKSVQQQLKQAAAISPHLVAGDCPLRTKSIDTIIDAAMRKNPELFVDDALPLRKIDGGFKLKRFSKYCVNGEVK